MTRRSKLSYSGSRSCIRSGETFTFTTKDPKNLPLPSVELLEMQWVLQRLVGMSGAAGWPNLDDDDDDTVDGNCNMYNSLQRVREWVGAEEAAGIAPETSTTTPGPSAVPVSLSGPEWTPAS